MNRMKNLGMGLDLLLSSSELSPRQEGEEQVLRDAESIFQKALNEDEDGKLFEAYYYYRQVMDCLEPFLSLKQEAAKDLLSQACNNAAVILFANGAIKEAQAFLEKALMANPRNQVARENLQAMDSDFKDNG
jgi:tetratricopeptide (TPR) repeat protein